MSLPPASSVHEDHCFGRFAGAVWAVDKSVASGRVLNRGLVDGPGRRRAAAMEFEEVLVGDVIHVPGPKKLRPLRGPRVVVRFQECSFR